MRPILRSALAAACLAGLTAPAALWAAPLDTTIRVEGSTSTIIPESAVVIDSEGTETLFSGAQSVTTPRSSAFWQLARATQTAALPFGFQVFDLGSEGPQEHQVANNVQPAGMQEHRGQNRDPISPGDDVSG